MGRLTIHLGAVSYTGTGLHSVLETQVYIDFIEVQKCMQ